MLAVRRVVVVVVLRCEPPWSIPLIMKDIISGQASAIGRTTSVPTETLAGLRPEVRTIAA